MNEMKLYSDILNIIYRYIHIHTTKQLNNEYTKRVKIPNHDCDDCNVCPFYVRLDDNEYNYRYGSAEIRYVFDKNSNFIVSGTTYNYVRLPKRY